MDREEALRMNEEKLRREHEAKNDEFWADGKVAVVLIPSQDDLETFSSDYQSELRSLQTAFRAAGIEAESTTYALDTAESFGGQIGEFAIPIAKYGFPALSGIIIGWLKGKAGRKVKVEFFADGCTKKIEAQTAEEVILMLNAVQRDARQQPKKKPQ